MDLSYTNVSTRLAGAERNPRGTSLAPLAAAAVARNTRRVSFAMYEILHLVEMGMQDEKHLGETWIFLPLTRNRPRCVPAPRWL
jgi:hypothetical protein